MTTKKPIIAGAIVLVILAILIVIPHILTIPQPEPISKEYLTELESGDAWKEHLKFFNDDCQRDKEIAEAGYSKERTECLEYASQKGLEQSAQKTLDEAMQNLNPEQTDSRIINLNLMLAATAGDVENLKKLLQMGADPNAQNALHMTALMSAANSGHADCVSALLSAGADPNIQDSAGLTALMLAANFVGNYPAVKLLVDAGANVNLVAKNSATALLIAAQKGCLPCLYVLVKAGADVNVFDAERHFSPLLFAATRGDTDAAMILVDAGADVNASSIDGLTPLMASAFSPLESDMLLKLLHAGANPNKSMDDGRNAEDFLLEGNLHFGGDIARRALWIARARRLFIF